MESILFLSTEISPCTFCKSQLDQILIGETTKRESILNYLKIGGGTGQAVQVCALLDPSSWMGFSNTLVQLFVASKKGRAFVVTNSKRRKVKPNRWPRCHSDRCNLISRVGFETKQRSRTVWRYEISLCCEQNSRVVFFFFFSFCSSSFFFFFFLLSRKAGKGVRGSPA